MTLFAWSLLFSYLLVGAGLSFWLAYDNWGYSHPKRFFSRTAFRYAAAHAALAIVWLPFLLYAAWVAYREMQQKRRQRR